MSPKGLVHNLFIHLFTLGTSQSNFHAQKLQCCDRLKLPSKVCNAFLRQNLCAFHFIWALGAGEEGRRGGASKRIGKQPVYASFDLRHLKNRRFF